MGVPNGVPKDVYFVYFWVSVWYTLLHILWYSLEILATSRWLNWILLRRLLQTHLVASKDPK